MWRICLESNNWNLVKYCLWALANVDWYHRVVVLEIRSICNVVEMVSERYPAVISQMESLALTSTGTLFTDSVTSLTIPLLPYCRLLEKFSINPSTRQSFKSGGFDHQLC